MLRRVLHLVIALAALMAFFGFGGFLLTRIPHEGVATAVAACLFLVGTAAVVWLMNRLEALAAARDAARREPPGFEVLPAAPDGRNGRKRPENA